MLCYFNSPAYVMLSQLILCYFKGTKIQSQFSFLMEKFIFYAKITVSQKKCVSKLSFKYYIGSLFS